jgi:hypothetical protein
VSVNPEIRSTNFQFAADHGNSVAASMWHEGGFETRPYKRPDCAMPPVLGLRERLKRQKLRARLIGDGHFGGFRFLGVF